MNKQPKAQDSWVQALISIQHTYYHLRSSQTGSSFQRYWMKTGFGGFEKGKFIVVCDEPEIRDWLADRGTKIAESALVGVLAEVVEVEFMVDEK